MTDDRTLLLFNRAEYHALNGASYGSIGIAGAGSVGGAWTPGGFDSGWSAPFGGFDLERDSVVCAVTLAESIKDQGPARIRCRPGFYGQHEAFALLNAGFTVEACGLNQHIDLAGVEKPEDYAAGLKREAKRALRYAAAEPFGLLEATSEKDWGDGYGVLARNREAKGRTLSLSLPYLLHFWITFPAEAWMLNLYHYRDAMVCAAALVYEVLPRRFYVVAWGDAFHDLPRSPMNRLAYEVVAWAIERGGLSLDLGISSVGGVADPGLVQFKQSIGAQPSLRLDLVWRP